MSDKIEKSLLGIAGEYFVAAELARRNIYAQLTLGNQKRTDLLIFSSTTNKVLKVEVKSKQSTKWPSCKGINSEESIIVFVDFQGLNENERPVFYFLTNLDWKILVEKKCTDYKEKHPKKRAEVINNELHVFDEKTNGGYYKGCPVTVSDVKIYFENWYKLIQKIA